jgi:lysophospholipase L1-like esterase
MKHSARLALLVLATIVLASSPLHAYDPKTVTGPPPKAKPSEPGWGFWSVAPQAWMQTCQGFLERTQKGDIDVVFLGDSITQGWGKAGKEIWEKEYAPKKAVNYGIGGDSTRQVLYRLDHGAVDGLKLKLVVLAIGTNNLYADHNSGTDEEIAAGIETIVKSLREKVPTAKILLLGILPRQNDYFSGRVLKINKRISKLADEKTVRFLDMDAKFEKTPGKGDVNEELYVPDKLHLSAKGYEVWAETMKPVFEEMVKD